jgi:cytochrome c oxidase assembly protein Cox11
VFDSSKILMPLMSLVLLVLMSQRAEASERLQKQSTSYVQKTRDIILRWSAKTDRGLKVSAQPLKLASRGSPGAESSMTFRFVNMTKSNVSFVAKPVVTPVAGSVASVSCPCMSVMSLSPGQSTTADVTMKLVEDFPSGIDTVVLRLKLLPVTEKSVVAPGTSRVVADGNLP